LAQVVLAQAAHKRGWAKHTFRGWPSCQKPSKMGCSSSAPNSRSNKDDDVMLAQPLIEIPDVEVIVLNATGSEGGVMTSGRFQLMLLQPKYKKHSPGRYRIIAPALLSSGMRHDPSRVIGDLQVGTCINVLEVVTLKEDMRVRGRVEDPPGWISLEKIGRWLEPISQEDRWAEKLDVIVIYVGAEEFKMVSSSDERTGFCYPLLPDTPLLLVYETCLISLNANDGDTFTIRLPKELPEAQLWQLTEMLPKYCNFRLEKKKDAADLISTTAGKIASGIDRAATGLAGMIERRCTATKTNMQKQDNIQIPLGAKAFVGTAVGATRVTATVTNVALDGLMGVATVAGREAGRRAGLEGQGGPPCAGKAALIGGLQVFDSLFRAAELVTTTATNEVSDVVAHRYGEEAGDLTLGAMEAGAKAIEIAATAKGDKALTKVTGRLAAKSATYKLAAKTIKPMAQGFVEGARESAAGPELRR